MEINALTDSFAVSAQITPAQVADVKAAGFSAIVCNRPDGEQEGQPLAAEIAQAAQEQGLDFIHIPMNGPNFTADDVANLQGFLAKHDKVFGFCRTGNRSSILFNAAQ